MQAVGRVPLLLEQYCCRSPLLFIGVAGTLVAGLFSLAEARGAVGLGVNLGVGHGVGLGVAHGVGHDVGFDIALGVGLVVGFEVVIFSSSVSSQAFPTMKHLRPLWQMPSGHSYPCLPQFAKASYCV
jgi:hypothetical protein